MISTQRDEDGALTLTVDGGPDAAGLREDLLLWVLAHVRSMAAPRAKPAPRRKPARAVEEPAEQPEPAEEDQAPSSGGLRDRILAALADFGPCAGNVLWSKVTGAGRPGPETRRQLVELVAEGAVHMEKQGSSRVYTLAEGDAPATAEDQRKERILAALQEVAPCSPRDLFRHMGVSKSRELNRALAQLETDGVIRQEGRTSSRKIHLVEGAA